MIVVLRKLSVNAWKTLYKKKINLCFVTGKMQGKKKVEGMTACLKKVECERMENFRKKNQPMVTWKMQGKKIREKKSKERQHVLRKLSVNGWKTL